MEYTKSYIGIIIYIFKLVKEFAHVRIDLYNLAGLGYQFYKLL